MSSFAKDTNVPTNDTISRQAAIRWVKTECNPYGKPTLEFESGKRVIAHLEQMPSAQQWIPCSERLPEEKELVLLCDRYGDMTLGRLIRTDEGFEWDDYTWWLDIDDWNAWMPLPKPYREDGEA